MANDGTAVGTVILSKYVRPPRPGYARERSLIRIIYSNSMHFACRDRSSAALAICTAIIYVRSLHHGIPGEISGELFATFWEYEANFHNCQNNAY